MSLKEQHPQAFDDLLARVKDTILGRIERGTLPADLSGMRQVTIRGYADLYCWSRAAVPEASDSGWQQMAEDLFDAADEWIKEGGIAQARGDVEMEAPDDEPVAAYGL